MGRPLKIQREVPIGDPPIGDPPTTYADWRSADREFCRLKFLGVTPILMGVLPILIFEGLSDNSMNSFQFVDKEEDASPNMSKNNCYRLKGFQFM